MTITRILLSGAFCGAMLCAQDTAAIKADTNSSARMTADKQGESKSDLKLTQAIRRSLVKDKSLSVYAHNVTIISKDGAVTLKGTVKSDDERRSVLAKAQEAAGGTDKVTDEMSVKQ